MTLQKLLDAGKAQELHHKLRINSVAEVFQNVIQQVLQGIPKVRNMRDGIIAYGKTQEIHNDSLKVVFHRLRENITLNSEKCEYSKPQLDFFGYVFSGKGISADPKRSRPMRT